uniref:Uncharacterized protein n=1 Tax=Acrobeloides nanus TaxID=290746 RepID=A0A914DCF0_9BILA
MKKPNEIVKELHQDVQLSVPQNFDHLPEESRKQEIVKELHQDVQLSLPQNFDHLPEEPRKQAQNILPNKTLGYEARDKAMQEFIMGLFQLLTSDL